MKKKTTTIAAAILALALAAPSARAEGLFSLDLSSLFSWLADELDGRGGWDPNGLAAEDGDQVESGPAADPFGLEKKVLREGNGFDPHGRPGRGFSVDPNGCAPAGDIGCGIDPNG